MNATTLGREAAQAAAAILGTTPDKIVAAIESSPFPASPLRGHKVKRSDVERWMEKHGRTALRDLESQAP